MRRRLLASSALLAALVFAAPALAAGAAPQAPRPTQPAKTAQIAAPRVAAAAEGHEPPAWATQLAARVPVANRKAWATEMTGLTPETATVTAFIKNRNEAVRAHWSHWIALAERLMPDPNVKLAPSATRGQAYQLFDEMAAADIGTNIPEDGCYARADVAAMAGRRAGFEMYKVNVYAPVPANFVPSPGAKRPALVVNTPNAVRGQVRWRYHVAPALLVDRELMVIDPSTADRPVTVAEWTAKMNLPGAKVVATSADQISHSGKVLTGRERLEAFAKHLGIVEGVRRGYQPVRAYQLVSAAAAPAPAP